jgi:hypothetical protein
VDWIVDVLFQPFERDFMGAIRIFGSVFKNRFMEALFKNL